MSPSFHTPPLHPCIASLSPQCWLWMGPKLCQVHVRCRPSGLVLRCPYPLQMHAGMGDLSAKHVNVPPVAGSQAKGASVCMRSKPQPALRLADSAFDRLLCCSMPIGAQEAPARYSTSSTEVALGAAKEPFSRLWRRQLSMLWVLTPASGALPDRASAALLPLGTPASPGNRADPSE